jgi:hypothetical protein
MCSAVQYIPRLTLRSANPGMHYVFETHDMQNCDRLPYGSANAYPFLLLQPSSV